MRPCGRATGGAGTCRRFGVNRRLQNLLKDENNQLKVDDAAKIIGCWKALSKQNLTELSGDVGTMQRAVAFCQVIELQTGAKTHKVSSKNIAGMFQEVVEVYQQSRDGDEEELPERPSEMRSRAC